MTGYGDGEREAGRTRIRAEIRTVNHRYLNTQIRTPPGWDRFHRVLERTLKDHFVRGHIVLSLTVEPVLGPGEQEVPLDLERARAYAQAFRRLRDELELEGEVSLSLMAGLRDIFRVQEEPGTEEVAEEDVLAVVSEAAGRVVGMREEEGARLRTDMEGRLDALEVELEGVEERAPARLIQERDRLRDRIRELLEGQVEVDEERIHREIAHLAERWDIHEEIVRFRSHIRMFRDTLEKEDPSGIGKRLGFIAQEMLREANTIGSKANDAGIAGRVVTLKEEIDRLREQLENVE